MLNIAVFFGGKSAEHDISVITGCQVMSNLDESKYNIIPIYIDGLGAWFTGKDLNRINTFKDFNSRRYKRVCLHPADCALYSVKGKRLLKSIDCAVLAMHGLNGEDGTLQGLLELSNIPYTSSSVTASAVCMDKALTKLAVLGLGLPALPYIVLSQGDFLETENGDNLIMERLRKAELDFPIILKPCNLGSSIGIVKVRNETELREGLEVAFEFDSRVLLEKCLEDFKEYNCSCLLGKSSVIEEPVKKEELLSFKDKYLSGTKKGGKGTKGMASLSRKIEADIPKELTDEITSMNERLFNALNCFGVLRTDFIYDTKQKKLYINEINSIPGSLSFYLWEAKGKSFYKLLNELIDASILRHKEKNGKKYEYISVVLKSIP